jgi:hypothetical protein
MIMTYEEAIAFREVANVPLEWEEANERPAPPLDRVEFTRRIVKVARKHVETADAWDDLLAYKKAGVSEFPFHQKQMQEHGLFADLSRRLCFDVSSRIFIDAKQVAEAAEKEFTEATEKGKPLARMARLAAFKALQDVSSKSLGEMIERLERAYQEQWENVHRYGVAEGARQSVLEVIYQSIRESNTRLLDDFTETNTVSQCFSKPRYISLQQFYGIKFLYFGIVETRLLGFLPIYFLFPFVLLSTYFLTWLYIAYWGASFMLIWFIPFALFISFLLCSKTMAQFWKNPNLTLGDIADKIVSWHCEQYSIMLGDD